MASESDKLAIQVLKAIPGAEEALAVYLVGHLPSWLRFYFTRLTPQDVDELTSLCAVHILENIVQFNGKASFDTWARKVTRNAVYDWFRTEATRKKHESSLTHENEDTGFSLLNILPLPIPNARQELDRKECQEWGMRCIEKIKNPRQRRLLKEHFVDGLSVVEIAERWGEKKRSKLDMVRIQAIKSFLKIVKEKQRELRLDKCSPRVLRR
jgi:RNA polymerase sigma factor (sigma-70 family)